MPVSAILAKHARIGYAVGMDIAHLSIILSVIGAAFCFVIAGAVRMERTEESNAEDMRALFDISSDAV